MTGSATFTIETSTTIIILERAERAMDSLEDDVLRGLSPEERETLRDLLLRALQGVPVEP